MKFSVSDGVAHLHRRSEGGPRSEKAAELRILSTEPVRVTFLVRMSADISLFQNTVNFRISSLFVRNSAA